MKSKKIECSCSKIEVTPLCYHHTLATIEVTDIGHLLEQIKVNEIMEHYPYIDELKKELLK